GLLVEYDLDEPLGLTERDRLAVADEREAPDPDLVSGLLGGGLREADRGDLRAAIGAAGDQPLVHRMRMEALDRFDADDALVLGLVREHRRARDVADRIDARHVGAAEIVDHDGAAIGLDPELFEPEPL